MGTVINAILIVIGGLLGLAVKKHFTASLQDGLYKALGVAVIIIGLMGLITNMITVTDAGTLTSSGELLVTISLALGALVGGLLHLQDHLNNWSTKIEQKFKATGFASSFLNGTLIFCVGAMAIIGSITDGLTHNPYILITKGILDGTTSVILAAASGFGVIFSAVPVLLYQGALTLSASALQGVLTSGNLIKEICMVGYALVLGIGINFLFPNKLKTADLLPALLIPVLYHLISSLF